MKLTPKQIQELVDQIDVNVDGFIARHLSPNYLSREQKLRLQKFGIVTEGHLTVDMAFKLGMLSDMLGRKSMQMSLQDMMKELKRKNYLPLSYAENQALERIKYNSYNEIKGLGNKWAKDLRTIIIEGDPSRRKLQQRIIRDTAKQAVSNRETFKWMSSELGHKTGDWARDWDRVSDFILHDAHDHGRAHDLIRQDGEDAKVYKHVFDHACKHCVKLYLTSGAHSRPRIFTVSELLANGTNVGKKVKDWKAVIGATHPWCRCELESVPDNSTWNDDNQRWDVELTEEGKIVDKYMKISYV